MRGRGESQLGLHPERELKKVIYRKYPEYEGDTEKDILLSYCIQGAYHAYLNNPSVDTESFVRVVEQIVKCLKPLL